MSNLNGYITKLECACAMASTIDRIKKLLKLTEDEFAFWQREAGLRHHLKNLNSRDIECLIHGAIQKHYARQERKEALEAHNRYMKMEQQ